MMLNGYLSSINARRPRLIVQTLGEILIAAGVVILSFVAWQLWWTDVEAHYTQEAAIEELRRDWRALPAVNPVLGVAPGLHRAPMAPSAVSPPAVNEPFAIVHIPRFGKESQIAVKHGVALQGVLNEGLLGHYPHSAMPGELGNFALAGHRVTYGRPLYHIADLKDGDPILVETGDAWYRYRVRTSLIVTPDQVDAIAAVPGHPSATPTERLLSLTACHPMYSAEKRYIVYAVMQSRQPKLAGAPTVGG